MTDAKDQERTLLTSSSPGAPKHEAFIGETEPTVRVSNEPLGSAQTDGSNHALPPISSETVSPIRTSLNDAEAARASTIGLVYSVIGVTTLAWVPFLGGDPGLRWTFVGVLVLFCVGSLAMWRVAKQPGGYGHRLFRAYGLVSVVTAFFAMAFLGPFSPTALVITLGIGFFGQGGDRRGAWAICLSAIVLTLLLMVGIMTGTVQDLGIFQGAEAGRLGMGFMLLMVPMVLIVTLFQARWSRMAIENAMASAVTAVIDANRKDVQIEEAQAELDRLFGKGGFPGRLTGETIGEYRLGPLLGRGASGEVYDSVNTQSSQRAAIKVLNSSDLNQPRLTARFHREGKIATQIRSPHVAAVYSYGQDKTGQHYIAMERLDGSDLAAILRRKGRISIRAAHELVQHVSNALTTAHDLGIVHRDIKPHNIFSHSCSDGQKIWKVLDFGISKWLSGSETLTHAGCVVGTPRYMAPEQARGEDLDHRSDVYSLGAVLYRALTGSPPFNRTGFQAISVAAFQRPIRPRELAPDLDRQVEAVLCLAMAPKPIDRFSTADALAKAFDEACRGVLSEDLMAVARKVKWRE